MPEEAETIYQAPDIRKQKLEDVESFIEQKRVSRLVMATKFSQTQLEKFKKIHSKDAERFRKQAALIEKAMERVQEAIEKLQERLNKLNELHTTLCNTEGAISDEEGTNNAQS